MVKKVGKWAWKNKWDIGLTAAGFIPGLGLAAWGVRAYKIASVARAGGSLAKFGKVGKRTSNLAGRMHTGRYFTPLRGKKQLVSRSGLKQYRVPMYKQRIGYTQSNFVKRGSTSHKFGNMNRPGAYNGHLRIR